MDEKSFLFLVGKKLSGKADRLELEALEQLMQQNKELEQLYKSLFSEKIQDTADGQLNAEQAYATHFVKMQIGQQFDHAAIREEVGTPVKSWKIGWLSAAAAAVLFVSILLLYPLWNKKKMQPLTEQTDSNKNEIFTKKGSKTNIRLPDGTQVWLNADSKITYPDNFRGATREVQLTGEAFFDVVKDKSRPFVIHTRTVDIKVLGTAFNVRSYPDEKKTETSLIRGLVEVTLVDRPDKKIILHPNEKLSVDNAMLTSNSIQEPSHNPELPVAGLPGIKLEKITLLAADSSAMATAWVNNKLVFDNEPFEQVALKIERWYNVNMVIRDEALKSLRFSAVFEKESLQEVMEALRMTTGRFAFRINNEQVTVYSK
jgi:ferric-dicitrate binding protein FerR (iron transport regulator)